MSSSTNKKALELLAQRPLEPVFTARDNGKAIFDLPDSYYEEKYTDIKDDIQNRYGENTEYKIPLRDLPKKPDLDFTHMLGKRRQFSLFNDVHKSIAGRIIKLFMDEPDEDSFIATCAYTKDRINPLLFQYCYAVAVAHRPDTKDFPIKPIAEQFPHNFVEPSAFQDARAEGEIIRNPGDRRHIEIQQNYTASDREEEQRLSYFREDIGVNSHHWHWHLVYPGSGPIEVVRKDRRGELFYYMHHQIIARYNIERFCNNLAKLKPLNNLRDPIPEGYFPKILSSLNNRTYPARSKQTKLSDVDRDENKTEIADIERWADRIAQAIDQGYVTDSKGEKITLDPVKGIDILGDLMESSDLSINRDLYGNLHNEGHNAISFAHDPERRYLEDFGVMGDVTTAMRDPIFYRWHGFIDGLFNRHKARLSAYTADDLSNTGVVMKAASVQIHLKQTQPNTLLTYWEKSDVDLGAGLDFGPQGNVFALFTHLQHAPFQYRIDVENSTDKMKKGTCRIFICPKTDERGTPLTLGEQRLLAVEMDKFPVDLTPGINNIHRYSKESSVTIPYERSFRNVGQGEQLKDAQKALAEFQFCGCGWPEHMLLPKGKPEGMEFDLFFMISDHAADAVQQTNNTEAVCSDSSSFCGLKDKLYPDKRAMGYPFDRNLPGNNLSALISTFPNMIMTDVKIIFKNVVVDRKKN